MTETLSGDKLEARGGGLTQHPAHGREWPGQSEPQLCSTERAPSSSPSVTGAKGGDAGKHGRTPAGGSSPTAPRPPPRLRPLAL